MMGLSIWKILIIVAVLVLLFGAGRIPRLAKDLGAGLNAFKRGLKESEHRDAPADSSPGSLEAPATPVATKDEALKG